jgi:hypothetical protein
VIINNLTDKKALGSYADIIINTNGGNIEISVSQYGRLPASYNFSKTVISN